MSKRRQRRPRCRPRPRWKRLRRLRRRPPSWKHRRPHRRPLHRSRSRRVASCRRCCASASKNSVQRRRRPRCRQRRRRASWCRGPHRKSSGLRCRRPPVRLGPRPARPAPSSGRRHRLLAVRALGRRGQDSVRLIRRHARRRRWADRVRCRRSRFARSSPGPRNGRAFRRGPACRARVHRTSSRRVRRSARPGRSSAASTYLARPRRQCRPRRRPSRARSRSPKG